MNPVVIIPCSALKLDRRAPAVELYGASAHWRYTLRAARACTDDQWIRVLSAKHGLVRLTTELDPYDMRLRDRGAVTPERVRAQAATLPLRDIFALLPRGYAELLRKAGVTFEDYMKGTRGIGDQRARLARVIGSST